MPAELQSTSLGQTLILTLSNPGRNNAVEPAMYASAIEALSLVESSAEIRSIVLTGADGLFCSGSDLQRLLDNRAQPRAVQAQATDGLQHWIEAIRTHPRPVIAAVETIAADAGFALALACDFIVCARNAVFAIGHGNVALSPEGGVSWSLAQALPRQTASEILMCGTPVGAERLHALGVVNRLAEPGGALQSALDLAEQLNARAPNALASIKELLGDAPQAALSAQLAQEREHFVRNLQHANAGTGLRAFLEKRVPRYEV